jgi:hypothetical protein
MIGDDKDKKPNKKSGRAIPKTTKKPPNSNQSTPKTARKGYPNTGQTS